MDKSLYSDTFIFSAHGEKGVEQSYNKRKKINRRDNNVYITVTKGNTSLSSVVATIIKRAFSDEKFEKWFRKKIGDFIKSEPTRYEQFVELQKFLEYHVIVTGLANTFFRCKNSILEILGKIKRSDDFDSYYFMQNIWKFANDTQKIELFEFMYIFTGEYCSEFGVYQVFEKLYDKCAIAEKEIMYSGHDISDAIQNRIFLIVCIPKILSNIKNTKTAFYYSLKNNETFDKFREVSNLHLQIYIKGMTLPKYTFSLASFYNVIAVNGLLSKSGLFHSKSITDLIKTTISHRTCNDSTFRDEESKTNLEGFTHDVIDFMYKDSHIPEQYEIKRKVYCNTDIKKISVRTFFLSIENLLKKIKHRLKIDNSIIIIVSCAANDLGPKQSALRRQLSSDIKLKEIEQQHLDDSKFRETVPEDDASSVRKDESDLIHPGDDMESYFGSRINTTGHSTNITDDKINSPPSYNYDKKIWEGPYYGDYKYDDHKYDDYKYDDYDYGYDEYADYVHDDHKNIYYAYFNNHWFGNSTKTETDIFGMNKHMYDDIKNNNIRKQLDIEDTLTTLEKFGVQHLHMFKVPESLIEKINYVYTTVDDTNIVGKAIKKLLTFCNTNLLCVYCSFKMIFIMANFSSFEYLGEIDDVVVVNFIAHHLISSLNLLSPELSLPNIENTKIIMFMFSFLVHLNCDEFLDFNHTFTKIFMSHHDLTLSFTSESSIHTFADKFDTLMKHIDQLKLY